ncbi:hypothetical protein A2574_03130 [Candidatus Shapirobacteria bacterium RIFOXYD1_FULL_38_32]|uniref:Uncharacterized protein n=4 Tax=Patescibacteria group TaxID=1783273 RepID=A0A0G0MS21_9BACT|nr:MAG: hypothetical protein US90_C0032G0011 [Candidatus Shapirobacteria bacterium GW2011_GWE2_38_30]KKQ90697.1 MAG: hypothetical protein UT14_C0031G0013 [Candidatus Shapirobacteria bacterium GW2011_GWE1_38_92]OGJ06435.1 MAG: hypothetical protein A2192_02455 [Candidatus Nomurabacteria bacterium RIFOXYA1_FULL_35_17]OGL56351.1 MAG: hypothetical protein A2410_01905 [Candidatus Shapirobacteria bacterium RIFOXYC1_FULL_38_24]OGL56494.1 MAG: hypothetical protein A2367_02835 [Candidatus Shapirobacteria
MSKNKLIDNLRERYGVISEEDQNLFVNHQIDKDEFFRRVTRERGKPKSHCSRQSIGYNAHLYDGKPRSS